jgi:hypothetical protein
MPKTLQTVIIVVGVILITIFVAVGGTIMYQYRNVSIDLSPKGWLSDEDRALLKDPKTVNETAFPWLSDEDLKVLKDPQAANKAAFEKLSREAWERSQSQQPHNGWNRGWKK